MIGDQTKGHFSPPAKIRYKTKEPLWEDCFSFFIHNPRRQELELEVKAAATSTAHFAFPCCVEPDLSPNAQVKDDKHKCTLGSLAVSLRGLLDEEGMTLTRCFPLKNSGPSSTIKLKMALRVKTLTVLLGRVM